MAERLIDAEALKRKAVMAVQLDGNSFPYEFLAVPLITIKNSPTIEAKPVVHAHWEEYWDYNCDNYSYCCSNCGKDALTKEGTMYDQVLTKFCPNCGAQMDEEVSE